MADAGGISCSMKADNTSTHRLCTRGQTNAAFSCDSICSYRIFAVAIPNTYLSNDLVTLLKIVF